jgi:hypothetical protein
MLWSTGINKSRFLTEFFSCRSSAHGCDSPVCSVNAHDLAAVHFVMGRFLPQRSQRSQRSQRVSLDGADRISVESIENQIDDASLQSATAVSVVRRQMAAASGDDGLAQSGYVCLLLSLNIFVVRKTPIQISCRIRCLTHVCQ